VAKKRTALSGLNDTLFQGIDPYGRNSSESSDTVTLLPIEQVLPDPTQPRQLIAAELLKPLFDGREDAETVLKKWLAQGQADKAESGFRRRVQELQQLAASIAQHGLINPVTSRSPKSDESLPAGVSYLIVTGERRYWAHVYLLVQRTQIQEGQTSHSPAQLKVSLTADGVSIRAHQLVENLIREDINAVEKARGLWALRYELSGVNDSTPIDQSGSEKLVPWGKVEEALGMSKRYRIFLTSVLNLCEEAQTIAFEHDLAEMTIRPITQKLKDYPDLQVIALNQLVEWQFQNQEEDGPGRPIVASVQELVDHLLSEQTSKAAQAAENTEEVNRSAASSSAVQSAQLQRLRSKTNSLLRWLAKLKIDDKDQLTNELQDGQNEPMRTELAELREQLNAILGAESEGSS
jgi:hypothetical protein